MLATLWCIVVVFGGLSLVGMPLTWLLNGRRPLQEADHVAVPFLGAAGVIVVLQNLVYLDVPLRLSTPFFWAATAVAWLWFWRAGGLRASCATYPWAAVAPAALVFVVQGCGLLWVGVREYQAMAWDDQYNYVCIAQFLVDVPFHTPWPALGDQPWLINVIAVLKDDRIGQSVLHGFFAVSSGFDARTLFEPSILLGPVLSALAVYALARRFGLGTGWARAASLTAGLMPGLAAVQLYCFLSHGLGTPFLLFFPVALEDIKERPGWRSLTRAALLFTAGSSIYTEFWILFLGVALLGLGTALWFHPRKGRFLLCHAALSLAPFALIPGANPSIWAIFQRLSSPILSEVYPWAYSLDGLARLWLGDWGGAHRPGWHSVARCYGLALTGLAYFGLGKAWLDRFQQPASSGYEADRGSLTLLTGVAAIAVLPLLILARDDQHPYQYYKMLESVGPLLALGLVLLGQRLPLAALPVAPDGAPRSSGRLRAAPGLLGVAVVTVLAAAGGASMAVRSASSHALMHQPDVVAVGRLLSRMPPGDLILGFRDPYKGTLNGWFSYSGRRQRIHLTDPHFIYFHPGWAILGEHILDPNTLPSGAPILLMQGPFQTTALGDFETIWTTGRFRLVKPKPDGSWALVYNFTNPNRLEGGAGKPFIWIGKGATTFQTSASRQGILTLRAHFTPRTCLPETQPRRLRVRTSAGFHAEFSAGQGVEELAIAVPAGASTITLESLDQPTQTPNGDLRPLLVGMSDPEFRFNPDGVAPGETAAGEVCPGPAVTGGPTPGPD